MTTPKSAQESENLLISLIKGFAGQARLSGVGALAKLQQEGGKLVDSLIKEGEKIDARQHRLDSPKADAIKVKPADNFVNVEQLFEGRVARALQGLKVPTDKDLQNLNKRMDALSKTIETLAKKD
jgi:poly(hydroxyalkanoate) granule-associated protein